jgi:hypothetical protein
VSQAGSPAIHLEFIHGALPPASICAMVQSKSARSGGIVRCAANGGCRSICHALFPGREIEERVMNTDQVSRKPWRFLLGASAAATVLILGCVPPLKAQQEIPAAQTVWQHVGRIYLDPSTGKAVYAGYVVHLNGVSASLFNGSPSEGTAYFTFSTDVIQLTPMPSNGDLTLFLVSAGTFNVYYNANPNGNWSDPSTFSSGKLIATFKRDQSLFPFFATIGVHPLSETLGSSTPFSFSGKIYNFGWMVPNGITFASYVSATPQTGTADYPVAYAAVGSTIAVGNGGH